MKIKSYIEDYFRRRRAKINDHARMRHARDAKGTYRIQALGEELYVYCNDTPVVPFSLLSQEFRADYKGVIDACREAFVKNKMNEF